MNEGLGFVPATAVDHLRAGDETLARVIETIGPFRLQLIGASSIFGALAQAIVYQQLTGKAAATIFPRPAGCAPRGRLRHPQGLCSRLQPGRAAGAQGGRILRRAMEALPDCGELVSMATRRAGAAAEITMTLMTTLPRPGSSPSMAPSSRRFCPAR